MQQLMFQNCIDQQNDHFVLAKCGDGGGHN